MFLASVLTMSERVVQMSCCFAVGRDFLRKNPGNFAEGARWSVSEGAHKDFKVGPELGGNLPDNAELALPALKPVITGNTYTHKMESPPLQQMLNNGKTQIQGVGLKGNKKIHHRQELPNWITIHMTDTIEVRTKRRDSGHFIVTKGFIDLDNITMTHVCNRRAQE